MNNITNFESNLIFTDWSVALKSGKYKQTGYNIKWVNYYEESFCVTGVLLDVLVNKYKIGKWQPPIVGSNYYDYKFHMWDELPPDIEKHLNIDNYIMMQLNQKKNFYQLADMIFERSLVCG